MHSKIGISPHNSARAVSPSRYSKPIDHTTPLVHNSARAVSPNRYSKTIDHTTPLVTFHYEPRLYHLNKLNYTLKNELKHLENDINSTTNTQNFNITKIKEDHSREIDTTVQKLDSN